MLAVINGCSIFRLRFFLLSPPDYGFFYLHYGACAGYYKEIFGRVAPLALG
jgi:hypothetical protein